MAALGKGVVGIFPDEMRKRQAGPAGSPFGCHVAAPRGAARARVLVTGDKNHGVVLVELDIDRAHRALGVVDLVDALLLLLQALVSLAAKRGQSGLDLLDL